VRLVVFEKEDGHAYKEGLQHRVTGGRHAMLRRSKARSFVFWMQTTAARVRWPTTREKIDEFKRAFIKPR